MTNQEIDDWVLEYLKRDKTLCPDDHIGITGIGWALSWYHLDMKLSTDEAKEIARKACQRLKKAGKLVWNRKTRWNLAK